MPAARPPWSRSPPTLSFASDCRPIVCGPSASDPPAHDPAETPMIDHSDDPSIEQVLDGNAIAGTLEMLFGGDMTAVPGRCATCGNVHIIGALRAYTRAPGA